MDGYFNPPWVHEEFQRSKVSLSAHRKKHNNKENIHEKFKFVSLLNVCAEKRDLIEGIKLHNDIITRRLLFLEKSPYLVSALISMYAKCGILAKAHHVLDELLNRNVVSWNALITGYAQQGPYNEALNCFERMRNESLSPDAVTLTCVLNACGSLGLIEKGEKIHAEVASKGLLSDNVVLGNAIVGMYVKCGVLEKAREVFDELPVRNAITWNALLSGYAQNRLGDEALSFFALMQDEGFPPNVVTFLCALSACISIGSLEKGEEIHVEIKKKDGLLENNASLGNALVDMYTKCGAIKKAQEVFDGLSVKDVISWTSLISGYTIHGLSEEALKCYAKMQDEGIMPDVVTYACVLKACGSIGSVDKGEEIHGEVHNKGLLKDNIMLGNALVDMYSKFGMLEKAYRVFDDLPFYDVVSWNVLLSGYAQLCEVKKAFISFNKMKSEGLMPDAVTFAVLLTACSHAGLIQDGQMYFDIMTDVYCLNPTLEHYICMVHLFSQAGHFDKALSVIRAMPCSHYPVLWLALLRACREWGNVKLAIFAFDQTVELDSSCAAAYVLMSNIFISVGMQEDAEKVRLQYAAVLRSGDM